MMKHIKRGLMVCLSMMIIASSMTLTYADEGHNKDVEIAEALGILKGDGNGLTEVYLKKLSTRFQAAVMVLRLKGLEEIAKDYSDNAQFDDAGEIIWKPGQAMLGYLKSNPDLGWQGSHNLFKPNEPISAKAYYKVMLELLGYKQDVDFKWDNVIEFAESVGLEEVKQVNELTNEQLAVATIETLKANTKEGKPYINELIENNVIDEVLADSLGLYVKPIEETIIEEPITAEMKSAQSIDTITVKVDFEELENIKKDNFTLIDESGQTYSIETIEPLTDEQAVILTVETLKLGEIYTLSYHNKSIEIVPIMDKNEDKPEIESAKAVTGEIVRVVLNTRNIRRESLVASNFTINNDVIVTNLRFDEDEMKKQGNHYKTILLLDVSNMYSGKAYIVKSDSILSYNGNKANFNSSNATFAGKNKDDQAPKVLKAESLWGYQVKVTFDEQVLLEEGSATNINNYSISPDIEVTDATIEHNILGGTHTVILTTVGQKSGKAYTLSVKGVSDGANAITSTEEMVFAGQNPIEHQEVDYVNSLTGTSIEVVFKYDANDTALDVGRYAIDHDVMVTDAMFALDPMDNTKLDRKKVILTTSAMKSGVAYKAKIDSGLQNILGQGLKDSQTMIYAGKDVDSKFTNNISVNNMDTFTVKVVFDEKLDRESATQIRNYTISDLGYPAKAVLSEDARTVTLTVPKQKSGTAYTLKMNNILDLSGNKIESDTKLVFAGKDK